MSKEAILKILEEKGIDFDTRALIIDDILDIINQQLAEFEAENGFYNGQVLDGNTDIKKWRKITDICKENRELKAENERLKENSSMYQPYLREHKIRANLENIVVPNLEQQLKEKDEEIEKFKNFAKFVTNALFDDWNEFRGYDELFCRQLLNLGLIKYSNDKKYYQPAIKLDGDMVVQYCRKIKVELQEKFELTTNNDLEKQITEELEKKRKKVIIDLYLQMKFERDIAVEQNEYYRKEMLRDGETFTMSQAKVFDEVYVENENLKEENKKLKDKNFELEQNYTKVANGNIKLKDRTSSLCDKIQHYKQQLLAKNKEIERLNKRIDVCCHPTQFTQLLKHENIKQVCNNIRRYDLKCHKSCMSFNEYVDGLMKFLSQMEDDSESI